jgi:hypothetical protein
MNARSALSFKSCLRPREEKRKGILHFFCSFISSLNSFLGSSSNSFGFLISGSSLDYFLLSSSSSSHEEAMLVLFLSLQFKLNLSFSLTAFLMHSSNQKKKKNKHFNHVILLTNFLILQYVKSNICFLLFSDNT